MKSVWFWQNNYDFTSEPAEIICGFRMKAKPAVTTPRDYVIKLSRLSFAWFNARFFCCVTVSASSFTAELPLHNQEHVVDAQSRWTFIRCFHFLWKHLAAENLFYGPSHIKATSKEWCKLNIYMSRYFTTINLLAYASYGTSDSWVIEVQETYLDAGRMLLTL